MKDITQYERISAQEKNFPIRILYNSGEEISAHWHEHLEILYFRSGSCKVGVSGETIKAEADDTVVINSNELHFLEKSENSQYFCIIINPKFFSDVIFDDVIIKRIINKDAIIKKCFDDIFLEHTLRHDGYDMVIKSIAYRLMAHLVRNHRTQKPSELTASTRNTKTQRITEILSYIDTHYSEKLTTAELAKKAYLNEQYFCQIFKKATGQSLVMYLNRYRIEKATVLLKNTELSITEIAMNVGFDNANYFSRIFRKHIGMNPREYPKNS